MQLLGSCFEAKLHSSQCARRFQRGLPAVCSARQLIRPKRTGLKVAASSDNGQNHPQAASSTPHNQLVPQNGTSPGSSLATISSTSAGQNKVNVHFEVPEYLTHWGQVLKVVGSLEELGNWKVEKAPKMEWHEGHTWTLDIQLPVGAVNFKVVMQEPHGGVRWEEGTDRSVMIPETTSVTGAPVGEVDVTCNFNDVHNSRIEVRPDRNYLKQQLKAVEARVMAIQEKKRKLDQRMSLLTEGLKKYDQTVSLLEGDVQDAIAQRQRSKEAAVPQQLDAPQQSQQCQQPWPASAAPTAAGSPQSDSRGSIMVPIMSPDELPSFEGLTFSTAESSVDTAEEIAAASAGAVVADDVSSTVVQEDNEAAEDSKRLDPTDTATVTEAASSSTDITAIKASHVNETVLSATVDQLLAAAEAALARSSSTAKEVGTSAPLRLDSNGVNNSQLAEEYVEELLAAASALEQQADQRASLLLEAAKQSGNDVIAADIEQLTVTPVPEMPSPNELAEAAAAAAVAAAAEEFTSLPDEVEEETSISTDSQSSTAAVEGVELALGDDGKLRAEAAVTIETPDAAAVQPASTRADRDGTITFTAESLNAQVDAKELLAAVLKRIGLPLSAMGQVTISATFTPSASREEQQEAADRTQQQQQDGEGEKALEAEEDDDDDDDQRSITSPAEAIAAAIGAAAAGRSSNGKGFGRPSRSSRVGNNGASGKYSKQKGGKARERGIAATAAQFDDGDDDFSVHGRYLDLAQQAEKQLAAKEAARRAAAEKVAAALAQVEEMRQSVVAANSMLAAQLRTGSEYKPATAAPAGNDSSSSGGDDAELHRSQGSGRRSVNGSSGTYSKYKVNYRNGGRNGSRQLAIDKSAPLEGPRSMPTVAAAAVMPQRTWQQQQQQQPARESGSDNSKPIVDGAVKEELLALAALAASVQSAVDVGHSCRSPAAEEEF